MLSTRLQKMSRNLSDFNCLTQQANKGKAIQLPLFYLYKMYITSSQLSKSAGSCASSCSISWPLPPTHLIKVHPCQRYSMYMWGKNWVCGRLFHVSFSYFQATNLVQVECRAKLDWAMPRRSRGCSLSGCKVTTFPRNYQTKCDFFHCLKWVILGEKPTFSGEKWPKTRVYDIIHSIFFLTEHPPQYLVGHFCF